MPPNEPGGRAATAWRSAGIDGASVRVLGAGILLYPALAMFAPKAMVVLLGTIALLLLLDPANRRRAFAGLPRSVVMLVAALAAWALVTVVWAPSPPASLNLWARFGGITLCGFFVIASASRLSKADRITLEKALVVAAALFVVLFGVELFTGGFLNQHAIAVWNRLTPWESPPPWPLTLLGRRSVALAVFVWPCALALYRRHSMGWAAAFVVVAAIGVFGQNMTGSKVAFAAAMGAFAAAWVWPRYGGFAALAAVVATNLALFAGSPEFVALDRAGKVSIDLPISWQERFYIIDFALGKVAGQPVFGWGFDASRALGQDTPGPLPGNFAIPLHPHNLWVQLWLELGLAGVLLGLGLVFALVRTIAARCGDRAAAAAALASLFAYLVIGNISFGVWQNWWLALAWLNAGFIAALIVPGKSAPR